MAMILIIGAPALVSMIDDSYNEDFVLETQLMENEDGYRPYMLAMNNSKLTSAYIPASENNGVHVITLVNNGDLDDVKSIMITDFDVTPIKDGASKITVKTNATTSSVKFCTNTTPDITPIVARLVQSETDPTLWSYDLSSVEVAKISADLFNYAFIEIIGQNAYVEVEINALTNSTIPYGEIIVGVAGAVLIMCALFATPWFGLGGVQLKKRS